MEPDELRQVVANQHESINALKENQFALVAQVQVLQAALVSALIHHPNRGAVLGAFQQYMKVAKEQAPQLAARMEGLEAGMASVLGKHQA